MSKIVRVAKRRNRPSAVVIPFEQEKSSPNTKSSAAQSIASSGDDKENDRTSANRIATRHSQRLAKVQQRSEQGQESDSEGSDPSSSSSSSSQEEGVFEVESILDRRERRGKVEYKIKWRKVDEITWEPKANLVGCPRLLRAFEEERKTSSSKSAVCTDKRSGGGPKRRGRPRKQRESDDDDASQNEDKPDATKEEDEEQGVKHKYGVKTEQGHRPENQDAYLITTIDSAEPFHMFGVLDGHGDKGRFASERGVEILRELVATSYESLKADKATQVEQKDDMELIQRALKQALSKADNELKADGEACGEEYGTTAVVCVQKGEHLIIANVGDSKAILFREAALGASSREKIKEVICTIEHKASCRKEAQRVGQEKGRIGKNMMVHPSEEEPKQSGLAMTRALGHVTLSKYGVISQPDFYSASLRDKDMLVLACDGLWDVLNTREVTRLVASYVKEGKDPQTIAAALVERAERKWIQGLGKGRVADNITVIVVLFAVA